MRLVCSLEPIRCIMYWQGLGLVMTMKHRLFVPSALCLDHGSLSSSLGPTSIQYYTRLKSLGFILISSCMPCSQGWHESFKHVCQSNGDLSGRRTRDLPCKSSAPTLSTSRSEILNCEKVEECHESKSSCPWKSMAKNPPRRKASPLIPLTIQTPL
jgi:hypothetical protein